LRVATCHSSLSIAISDQCVKKREGSRNGRDMDHIHASIPAAAAANNNNMLNMLDM